MNVIDAAHIERQRAWSLATFGPGDRLGGVLDHIRKELIEIEMDPTGFEWIDVLILALDGAWRAGHEPQTILDAWVNKQTKNENRVWPDWRTMSADKAIEHDRTFDQPVFTQNCTCGKYQMTATTDEVRGGVHHSTEIQCRKVPA